MSTGSNTTKKNQTYSNDMEPKMPVKVNTTRLKFWLIPIFLENRNPHTQCREHVPTHLSRPPHVFQQNGDEQVKHHKVGDKSNEQKEWNTRHSIHQKHAIPKWLHPLTTEYAENLERDTSLVMINLTLYYSCIIVPPGARLKLNEMGRKWTSPLSIES